jgi:hypothetical protein
VYFCSKGLSPFFSHLRRFAMVFVSVYLILVTSNPWGMDMLGEKIEFSSTAFCLKSAMRVAETSIYSQIPGMRCEESNARLKL